MPRYGCSVTVCYLNKNVSKWNNECITIGDKNDTILYHETENPKYLYIKPLLIMTQGSGQGSPVKSAPLVSFEKFNGANRGRKAEYGKQERE